MEAFDCKNEFFLLAPGNSALQRVAKLLIREDKMNLAIWLPSLFLLGIVLMVLCILFLKACEKI